MNSTTDSTATVNEKARPLQGAAGVGGSVGVGSGGSSAAGFSTVADALATGAETFSAVADSSAGTNVLPQLGACCHGGEAGEGEANQPGVQEDQEVWAKTWLRVAIAAVFGGQGMVLGLGLNRAEPRLEPDSPVYWVLHGGLLLSALVAFALLGWPLVKNTFYALRERRISVEALFLLSAIGALAASLVSTFTGYGSVYYEIVAIVLAIYTVGKLLGARTRARALAAAKALGDEFEYAYVDTCCGSRRKLAVADLVPGMSVLVGPGEPIAVDGVITRGEGFVVETAMTGETEPVRRLVGERVWAGSYSVEGTFAIESLAVKGQRRIDAVLETIVQAQLRPSQLQRRSDKLMMYFVPFVACVSITTFIVWSLLVPWQQALFNSMAVLLVACPCALGLATPIAVWSALIKLSRVGLVARSGDFCDTLALSRRIVFDKTGTISTERLEVHSCHWLEPQRADEWLPLIRAAEQASTHPVARALAGLGLGERAGVANTAVHAEAASRAGADSDASTVVLRVLGVDTVPGKGIVARLERGGREHTVAIGQSQLFEGAVREQLQAAAAAHTPEQAKRQVWVSVDGKAVGIVFLSEALRANVAESLAQLRGEGVAVEILTGDPEPLWEQVGGVKVHAGLSPLEKEQLVRQWCAEGEQVVFVGDGVNDASAMSIATASIAMSGGAELTRASATAVLVAPTLEPIVRGRKICQAMRRTLYGNMYFALVYNLIGISLAAFGVLNPVVAALLMLVSSFMVSYRAAYSARKL